MIRRDGFTLEAHGILLVKAPQWPKAIGVLFAFPENLRFAVAVGPAVIRRSEVAIGNGDLEETSGTIRVFTKD